MARLVLVAALFGAWLTSMDRLAHAQADRRGRAEPELVVETGARTGACDVLTFTPDGRHLLAAGDDKVVRSWRWDDGRLSPEQTLRWSIWREQRGSIYALALSSDPECRFAAVGGVGVRNGSVAVLDRRSGEVVHALTGEPRSAALDQLNNQAVWSLAFAPSGKLVAIGQNDGGIRLWDLGSGKTNDVLLLGRHRQSPTDVNRVRLLTFLNESQLLSVAQDGEVLRWTVDRPNAATTVHRFAAAKSIFRAVLSADRRRLAVAGEGSSAAAVVELLDLTTGQARTLAMPSGRNYPQALAFDASGERLAVALRTIPADATFFKEVAAGSLIFDLRRPDQPPLEGPRSTYRVEALAFHPSGGHLAQAGGDDHEIQVWDLRGRRTVDVVRGPGSGLWGVGLQDGRYLGFQDHRAADPSHPNRWGTGPWRVFDLQEHKWADGARDFRPVEPLLTAAGWSVRPDRDNAFVWRVVGPDGQAAPLPLDPNLEHMPRCYTFLPPAKGKPARLAVGHYWGISLYELTDRGPRRTRIYFGHQGEVMAVAPSADGQFLVSASRDQTINGWTLADWKLHPDLGVGFVVRSGKLFVDAVDFGSPGWEAGLSAGDEVLLFAYGGSEVKGGPDEWRRILARPEPNKQCYFRVRRAGEPQPLEFQTTLRQRPLWRFFPTRDREWVLWRWQDFVYDTSANGDFFIGWQVSGDADRTPAFHRAEQFRQRFHRPELLRDLFRRPAFSPDPPRFAAIEPPAVRVEPVTPQVRDQNATLKVTVKQHGPDASQGITRVKVWVNEHLLEEVPPARPGLTEGVTVTVPRSRLAPGSNRIIVQAYNRAGGRGEQQAAITVSGPPPAPPTLHILCVGVGNYRTVKPVPLGVLTSPFDARALADALRDPDRRAFGEVKVKVLTDRQVTRTAILDWLNDRAKDAQPGDRLVLALSGHGVSAEELNRFAGRANFRVEEPLDRGGFVYVCGDTDLRRPRTTALTGEDLYQALGQVPCRKLVLVDACHAAAVGAGWVRGLTPDAVGPTILAACEDREQSIEYPFDPGGGLFSFVVREALGPELPQADANRDGRLDPTELCDHVKKRVPALLDTLKRQLSTGKVPRNLSDEDVALYQAHSQHPVSFPPRGEDRLPIIALPRGKGP
jgi:WD40 repeat protein